MLQLENVRYSKAEHTILHNINISFKTGELVAIIGDNGAGKSSLLNAIYEQQKLELGAIYIDGIDISGYRGNGLLEQVTKLSQDPKDVLFEDLTIGEHLTLVNDKVRKQDFVQYLNFDYKNKHNSSISSLSGGQRQSLAFAFVASMSKKILLLDEHTSALDKSKANDLLKDTLRLVKDRSLIALMVTHDFDLAEKYCDRIIKLKEGRLCVDKYLSK